MKKEIKITPLSKFPTEVLVYNYKKLRICCHYEFENEYYDLERIDETHGQNFDNEVHFSFEGMYWSGYIDDLKKELDKRPHVDITVKNFKDWKREYNKKKKR